MVQGLSLLNSIIPSNLSASLEGLTGPQQLFAMLGALFVFLYGMSVGKTRALISLLAIYVAFELTNLFPYLNQLIKIIPWQIEPYMLQTILFLTLYLLIFIILNKSSLQNRLSSGEISFWQVLLISVLQIGLLAATVASFAPAKVTREMLRQFYPFFATQTALFLWSVGSLAILPIFIKGKRRKTGPVPLSK